MYPPPQDAPLDLSLNTTDRAVDLTARSSSGPASRHKTHIPWYLMPSTGPMVNWHNRLHQQRPPNSSYSPLSLMHLMPPPVMNRRTRNPLRPPVGSSSVSSSTGKPKQLRYRTERPFGCPVCAKTFTLRSNLERHGKQQHTGWGKSPSNRDLKKQQQVLKNQHGPSQHVLKALSNQLIIKQRQASATATTCLSGNSSGHSSPQLGTSSGSRGFLPVEKMDQDGFHSSDDEENNAE